MAKRHHKGGFKVKATKKMEHEFGKKRGHRKGHRKHGGKRK